MDKFLEKKKSMIKVIKNYGIKDKNVLKAMLKIPRHLFVPKQLENYSYEDMPLQIGNNQTISQPYTIAFMLQELGLKKKEKVLEIGTGSGYSAALISEITKTRVYTTEIISGLALKAEQNLIKAKVKNVKVLYADGSLGIKEYSPYDKILINAACPDFPEPLIRQLKNNGIIIAPVGGVLGQEMVKGIKRGRKLEKKVLGNFIFVPLKGEFGWE
ncbi:MAG: Protein-L-isoaspartate O-methyltransferase [archaeon GW2011_AR20]|nr:MAG: Protein-L-isoaspartate O-methyltransferase [archaeon GW2011_AR20]MBS3160820.1 protein-L-isoaspartate(D-aspartate) O-methyltransferase [Candidatus Woesearchaeota archaeon]